MDDLGVVKPRCTCGAQWLWRFEEGQPEPGPCEHVAEDGDPRYHHMMGGIRDDGLYKIVYLSVIDDDERLLGWVEQKVDPDFVADVAEIMKWLYREMSGMLEEYILGLRK